MKSITILTDTYQLKTNKLHTSFKETIFFGEFSSFIIFSKKKLQRKNWSVNKYVDLHLWLKVNI